MGKNKKRRRSAVSSDEKSPPKGNASIQVIENPLLSRQSKFLNNLSEEEREGFFSPKIDPERRAELWMEQADIGEDLINKYSWATPNSDAIKILKEFSPIVEIGAGANAYWCKIMKQAGIDIVGYDSNVDSGGQIEHSEKSSSRKKQSSSFQAKEGGPEVLLDPENSHRTLFLCYPDEEDDDDEDDDGEREERYNDESSEEEEEEEEGNASMGSKCLEYYKGTYIIHVGELAFVESSLSIDQAPWGRSSSSEFQQRLMTEYHCLLKVQLPNWLHVRDSISVWKRSETTTIVFAGEDSDDEDEEVEYRHIPRSEQLPLNLAAPCLAHLLPKIGEEKMSSPSSKEQPKQLLEEIEQCLKGADDDDSDDSAVDAGRNDAGPKQKAVQEKKKRRITSNQSGQKDKGASGMSKQSTKKAKKQNKKGKKKGGADKQDALRAMMDDVEWDDDNVSKGRKGQGGNCPW